MDDCEVCGSMMMGSDMEEVTGICDECNAIIAKKEGYYWPGNDDDDEEDDDEAEQ